MYNLPSGFILCGIGHCANDMCKLDICGQCRYGVMHGMPCSDIWLDQGEFDRYRMEFTYQLCPNQSDPSGLCVW